MTQSFKDERGERSGGRSSIDWMTLARSPSFSWTLRGDRRHLKVNRHAPHNPRGRTSGQARFSIDKAHRHR